MKKILSGILMGVVLAALFTVAAPAQAQGETVSTANVQARAGSDVYAQYLNVLQRYKTAQDNNFYKGWYDAQTLMNMGLNPNIALGSTSELHYTLVDLAGDGTPELFIANLDMGSSVLPYNIYDLYGYENGVAKRIVDNGSTGYRVHFFITENGYLDFWTFSGARDEINQYFTVAANSASPIYEQSLEYISWTGDEYYKNDGAYDYYNKYAISKAEYDSIKASYPRKQNITWHPISDDVSLWNALTEDAISVYVDGAQIALDQPPMIQEGRTLVPLRGVFEALGAVVYWDGCTRSVTAYKGDTTIALAIGSSTMYVNDVPIKLDVAGQIVNGRTMVPLRVISENLGAEVYWDGNGRTIRIYSDASAEPPMVDEREAKYNEALEELKNGYSYEAYYDFLDLGDYKDSQALLEQALWLNRLSMNITYWGYSGINDHSWYKNYSKMTENEIYSALVNKTFYIPSNQSPQFSAILFKENDVSYALGNNTNLNTRFDPGNWYISKNGVFLNSASLNMPTIYDQTFIKLTDGVYANIISDQLRGQGPGMGDLYFIDESSLVGQGLKAYYDRYDYANWTTQSKPDANGIYYLY